MKKLEKFQNLFQGGFKKLIYYLAIIALAGVLLMLLGGIVADFSGKKNSKGTGSVQVNTNNSTVAAASSSYDEKIKKELENVLSKVEGVGNVSVMVYFETGVTSVPAADKSKSTKTTEETDSSGGKRITTEENETSTTVILNNGSSTDVYTTQQVNPTIGGVMVVAEGASDPILKEALINAVKTVLNIGANKVSVMAMKK